MEYASERARERVLREVLCRVPVTYDRATEREHLARVGADEPRRGRAVITATERSVEGSGVEQNEGLGRLAGGANLRGPSIRK